MSKLVDRLDRVGRASPNSIGFGRPSESDRSGSGMVLIGQSAGSAILEDATLLQAPVDAVMVLVDDWRKRSLDRLKSALKEVLWGVRADDVDCARAESLKERGCDFMVFGTEETEAAVLNDDDLGKFIMVSSSLSGREARGIRSLPIDGVFLDQGDALLPLTVRKLLEVRQVGDRAGLPSLLATSCELDAGDLQAVRDAGITALVMDLAAGDLIRKSSEVLTALPRRKPRAGFRARGVSVAPSSAAAAEGRLGSSAGGGPSPS